MRNEEDCKISSSSSSNLADGVSESGVISLSVRVLVQSFRYSIDGFKELKQRQRG
jgi:hypothetical protein